MSPSQFSPADPDEVQELVDFRRSLSSVIEVCYRAPALLTFSLFFVFSYHAPYQNPRLCTRDCPAVSAGNPVVFSTPPNPRGWEPPR